MIIHGKNVEFVIGVENTPSSLRSSIYLNLFYNRVLKSLEGKNKPYVKELFKSYWTGSIEGFLYYFKKIIMLAFTKELEENPQFITSDNFKIYINLSFKKANGRAQYLPSESTTEDFYLRIYVIPTATQLFKLDFSFIEQLAHHEFIHHLSYCFGENVPKRISEAMNRLQKNKPEKEVFINYSEAIIGILARIVEEGRAEFAGLYRTRQKILFRKIYFSDIQKSFESIADFKTDVDEVYGAIAKNRIAHHAGSILVATIVLNILFENNKKFSAWINPHGFIFIGKKQYNATDILKFYGLRNFDLFFTYDDEEANEIIEQTIDRLIKMSHLGFLKEYGEACNKLGVLPFITLDMYNQYKKRCFVNFQKLKTRKT